MKSGFLFIVLLLFGALVNAQTAMNNVYGRKVTSLNGDWKIIIDPVEAGKWRQVWLEKQPQNKTDFYEYSFEDGPSFHVPGDFNTQMPEIFYMQGTVWYRKNFSYSLKSDSRLFVHFGAVNYEADVYFNGKLLGTHEGGFTPFQFELTPFVKDGKNSLVVRVNSERKRNGIPGLGFDWFNYGGITRDVNL